MIEAIQHLLGICPDSNSHLGIINLIVSSNEINFSIFKFVSYLKQIFKKENNGRYTDNR